VADPEPEPTPVAGPATPHDAIEGVVVAAPTRGNRKLETLLHVFRIE